MKALTTSIFLMIACHWAQLTFAQINNTFLSDKTLVNPNDSNTWGFTISNFNYLRNTEYFNTIESGRTLFGYQLHPQLYVQPFTNVKLKAGLFAQSDFGATPTINRVLPTFSITFVNAKQTESFTFGTLDGALAHRLIEPLFDINSAIERRIENGAQFKSQRERLFVDSWINWERFIERGSPYKEQFTAGFNMTPTVFKTQSRFEVTTPLQVLAFHRGGQIDVDTSNMLMQVNAAIGVDVSAPFAQFWKWQASCYYAHYQESSNSGYMPYRNGNGVFLNAALTRKNITLMASYWQGNQWIAPRGTALYQSVSIDQPGVVQPNRELLFMRFLYAKSLRDNLHIVARIEPVYDMQASLLDFSYSLYLVYHFDKRVGKL